MGKDRKETLFSKEEKEIIQSLKHELKMMGIPRNKWARYIQQELNYHRNQKSRRSPLKKESGIIGFFKNIWNKIISFFFKSVAKRFTKDEELIEEFQKYFEEPYQLSEEEKKIMDMLNPQVHFNNVDELGKGGGTFKKKGEGAIIEFDDEKN
jgi:hypothetical protein